LSANGHLRLFVERFPFRLYHSNFLLLNFTKREQTLKPK
jgi:hypothetical protein